MNRVSTNVGVITGDVIGSRKTDAKQWLKALKKALATMGATPRVWEIYRGDSFQVEVADPALTFMKAVRIKAYVRNVNRVDVRMGIGIGNRDHSGGKITESFGQAFIYSGQCLDEVSQENRTLGVRSPWVEFDKEFNLLMRFASIIMDDWTPNTAELVKHLIDDPNQTQLKLAKRMKITQGAVSGRLNRSYFSEILALDTLFRERVNKLLRS